MNFDRYNNANQYDVLIKNPIHSIQFQRAKLKIFEHQTSQNKVIVFLDNKIPDHKELVSYFERSHCQKWSAMEPYLYFDELQKSIIEETDVDKIIKYLQEIDQQEVQQGEQNYAETMNILLVGQTDCDKSTFINSFQNYMKYSDVYRLCSISNYDFVSKYHFKLRNANLGLYFSIS